jgi:hypothetical protein
MEKIRLQDRAELKEFLAPNTTRGLENKTTVLNRLGLTPETKTTSINYVMRGGVPHKIVDGVYIALTKKAA